MGRFFLVMLMLLTTGPAWASGWSPPLTVESAFTEDSDMIVIYTSDAGVYTPGCSQNAWVYRATTETRRARAWATVLAALTSGQELRLWYSDNCSSWSYHDATAIMLRKAG